jgi:glycosyltransferase involved in cell wall biosynthesis
MEYCIIASNYPTTNRQVHVFLKNVVESFVNRGIVCNVIAPQSSFAYFFKKKIRREFISVRTTSEGNKYTVYSPLYTVFPIFKLGKLYFSDFTKKSFYKAIKKSYKDHNMNADIVYSHFFQAGVPAVKLAKKIGVPSFIANGEANTISEVSYLSLKLINETLENVSGIISVSSKNKEEIFTLCDGDNKIMKKVRIIPNAADNSKFYKKDKAECRKKLGFPEDAFIVAFTGSFIERKGILKLSSALDRYDDIYSIFIGEGESKPTCKNILHMGRVQNTEVCNYLNSADVFVLPSLAEGCSNAIVEAVCCGVPVISSDRPFNYDILDNSNSILIDPLNENEIYEAIKTIKDDKVLRKRLSEGCLNKAKELSLKVRVDKIMSFIDEVIGSKNN